MTYHSDTIADLANSGRLADWEMAKALLVGAGVCEAQDAEEYLWNRVLVPVMNCGEAYKDMKGRNHILYYRSYWGYIQSLRAAALFSTRIGGGSVDHGDEYRISPYKHAEPI